MAIKKSLLFLTLFGFFLNISPTPVFSMDVGTIDRSQAIQIEVKEGLLTVSVKKVPLPVILKKLADQTGLGFEIYADVNLKISAKFKKTPLENGIKRLLKSCDHLVMYSDTNKGSLPGSTQILKIIIFDESGQISDQPIIARNPRPPYSSQTHLLSSSLSQY